MSDHGDVLSAHAFNSALYNKLESFLQKALFFYDKIKNQNRQYLFNLISIRHSSYTTRYVSNLPFFNTKHSFFKKLFYLLRKISCSLYDHLRILRITVVIRKAIKSFDRLGLSLNHLREHKFKHSFQDSVNLCVIEGTKLNLQFIFSQMKEALSLALCRIQTVNYFKKPIPFW